MLQTSLCKLENWFNMSSSSVEAIREQIDLFESSVKVAAGKETQGGSVTLKIEATA